MAHVIVLDSVIEDIFVCGSCKSVFNSLELFVSHKALKCTPAVLSTTVNVSSESSTLSTYDSASEINPNFISTQGVSSKSLSCHLCQKKFKNKKGLSAHTKSHYMKSYQCPICGRCFMQNSHLQRHILSHKVWPESLSETVPKTSEAELLSYSCPYCQIILPNYNGFRSHLKNHQAIKKFKCIQDDCAYFTDTLEMLLQHVSFAHSSLLYSCHLCKDVFISLETIATHQQNHTNYGKISSQATFKCIQCDAKFKRPEKLSLHMLTENHNKLCIHCKRTFASDKRLRLHLQTHRKMKPFQCNLCGSSFHMKKYLSTHMLRHGLQKFECSICKNMYKRPDLLQRHMRLHQSSKMLDCPYKNVSNCKRVFSRKDKLNLHIKSHLKHTCQNSVQN